jgi:hypothetical protein
MNMGVVSAIGMLGIALIVAWIAYMQYKVNHERLRFELYEKRFSIYRELKLFILDIIRTNDFLTDENIEMIYRMNDEAVFLFGDDVVQCINEIKKKTNSYYRKTEKLRELEVSLGGQPISDHRVAQLGLDIDTLKMWFDEQLDELPKKFLKYLKFEIIEKKCVISRVLDIIRCKP